jgi:YaiO family outer membrane protein
MMKKGLLLILISLLFNQTIMGQKVNTDSLLVVAHKRLNVDKDYRRAKVLCLLGVKKAPDYLDFHLALGRIYAYEKQIDSARYHFNYVINKNTKYKEAFSYLAKLEIDQKNQENAINTIDKALAIYPNEKEFDFLKLEAIKLDPDNQKTLDYLNTLQAKYPDNNAVKQELIALQTKIPTDRVGVSYALTNFDRAGVGPWHLMGFTYVHDRKKLTLIGGIHYANRQGSSVKSGIQYEIESYFLKNKTNYSYADLAFSDSNTFPKLRLAYTYFQSFKKGWEGDLGARYIKTTDNNIYTGAVGVSKYLGAYWLNFRSFLQYNQNIYPSFAVTARYYLDTRFDYISVNGGYGSSPDERETLGQFDQRFTLKSYRIGAGYNKLITNHYIAGIQTSFNRQEYNLDKYQNEWNIFVSLQYKF